MGSFLIDIQGAGDHRSDGFRRAVASLVGQAQKRGFDVKTARLVHWPGEEGEVEEDLKVIYREEIEKPAQAAIQAEAQALSDKKVADAASAAVAVVEGNPTPAPTVPK